MNERVLVITHGIFSQIITLMSTLKDLEAAGKNIAICSHCHMQEYSEYEFSKFYKLEVQPFGLYFERVYARNKKKPNLEKLNLRSPDDLYIERNQALCKILDRFQPDLILFDTLYSTDLLLIRDHSSEYKNKVLYFSIKPSYNRTTMSPPMSYSFIPVTKYRVNISWFIFNRYKKIKRLSEHIKYIEYDSLSILTNKLKNNTNFSKLYSIIWRNCGYLKFDNIPELVFLPKEFEYQPFRPTSMQQYVDFYIFEMKSLHFLKFMKLFKIF